MDEDLIRLVIESRAIHGTSMKEAFVAALRRHPDYKEM